MISSLSPSRAADFKQCPLLYRFRVIDRIPEPPSPAATRGTLVHAVLEQLFDEPGPERTLETAAAMLAPVWGQLRSDEPQLADLFADQATEQEWLASAADLLAAYFELEDPAALEPAERELSVEAELDDGLLLRGFVDRLDVAADGRTRVVDYKTGRSPRDGFETKAMFQMRFYALVLWRQTGRVPSLLQLMYLANGEVLRYEPDEADLLATERQLRAIWNAIRSAEESGDFRPSPSRLCDWCEHKERCPAFGGTPPPMPIAPPTAPNGDDSPSPYLPVEQI